MPSIIVDGPPGSDSDRADMDPYNNNVPRTGHALLNLLNWSESHYLLRHLSRHIK